MMEKEVVGCDAVFTGSDEDRWTIAEEELLLDAVEHHGFGSWFVTFMFFL
jgi:hypothetical protein